tara:strand:+ start:188 stop:358 length:171 start_codon:yes stop_codon:yes gene_type:complete
MPKKSYKSMSSCMSDYKGIADAAKICQGKVQSVKKDSGNTITPQPDPRLKKSGGSY